MKNTKVSKALKDWFEYEGFASARNREEQVDARKEQERLADEVKKALLEPEEDDWMDYDEAVDNAISHGEDY